MASPPFVISDTIPGDTDIVSQFPGVDRTYRDVVSSWLLVDHNNNPGGHVKLTMDQISDPTPVSGKTLVSARTDGSVVKQVGSAAPEYVGNPPATIIASINPSVPQGYLLCNGQAVSRTTYATLFGIISTTYGTGDGSTTFNVPDLGELTLVGYTASSLLIPQYNATILGTSFGEGEHTLLTAELATHGHTVTVTDPGHTHTVDLGLNTGGGPLAAASSNFTGTSSSTVLTATTGITAAANNTGSSTAHNNVQPSFVVNYLIKY